MADIIGISPYASNKINQDYSKPQITNEVKKINEWSWMYCLNERNRQIICNKKMSKSLISMLNKEIE